MQVLRTSTSAPGAHHAPPSSYAPLYLSTTLGEAIFDIEELEAISLDRLNLLKAIESARTASSLGTSSATLLKSIQTTVKASERKFGFTIPPANTPQNDDRRKSIWKDEASHFLLRLALCKDQQLRSWLLQTEYDLFYARLQGSAADQALASLRKVNGPQIYVVEKDQYNAIREQLEHVARGIRQKNDMDERYYKIRFEDVPLLVKQRRVFLQKGFAYIPEGNVKEVVALQFRSRLSHALSIAVKGVSLAEKDPRMRPILESIRQHYAANDLRKGFDPTMQLECISLPQLPESISSMPLCMLNMYQKLRDQHHLRYSARLQLGVFLKGCGLTLDESLQFWRSEFGKGSINADKFQKNYSYNIRHHYGKEGKRKNLTPFSCMRIINDRPGPGEHNGCPYREFEQGRLKSVLISIGTDAEATKTIVEKARQGNYQAACGMCFASSQPGFHASGEYGLPEYIPSHPNEYFIEARRRRFGGEAQNEEVENEDIADDEMLMAVEAMESQTQSVETPLVTPSKIVRTDAGGDGDMESKDVEMGEVADQDKDGEKENDGMADVENVPSKKQEPEIMPPSVEIITESKDNTAPSKSNQPEVDS